MTLAQKIILSLAVIIPALLWLAAWLVDRLLSDKPDLTDMAAMKGDPIEDEEAR